VESTYGHVTKHDDSATLVAGISKAMRKAGISRDVVFVKRGSSPKQVYVYSVLPSDTTKIVREAADGTRTIGRFSNGQFRAVKSKNT
jgi:hypothetical protein